MLDFYLLGVARSGTSAACRVLNLHPNIYCGMERFDIFTPPHSIIFPDSFLDAKIPGNPAGVKLASANINQLIKDGRNLPRIIGDKSPRKIYAPSHLMSVNSIICIYRNYENVCASWNVRSGTDWPKHRTGFIAFLDLMIFFSTVCDHKNICFIDYNNLFFGKYEPEIDQALKTVGASAEQYPYQTFKELLFQRVKQKKMEINEERYKIFSKFINLDMFEADFSSSAPADRINLAQGYGTHIKKNIKNFLNTFFCLIKQHEINELFCISDTVMKTMRKKELKHFFPSDIASNKKIFFIPDSQEKRLSAICQLFPDTFGAHIQLSHIYKRNMKIKNAIDEAKYAIALKDNNPNFYRHLGDLLCSNGDIQEAEEAYKKERSLLRDKVIRNKI